MVKIKFNKLPTLHQRLLIYFTCSGGGTTSSLGVSCFNSVFPIVHPEDIYKALLSLVETGYLRSSSGNMDGVCFTQDGYHECQVSLRLKIKLHKLKTKLKSITVNYVEKIILITISAIVASSVTYYFTSLNNEKLQGQSDTSENESQTNNKPNE